MTWTITYRVILSEPALLTEETGEANSAVSQIFLPGSALRGALIGRYLAGSNRPADAATDANFRRLFLDGAVRCLNGFLVIEGVRTLPVPLSWHHAKDQLHVIYDFAHERPDGEQTWQGTGGPFWAPRSGGASIALKFPERQVAAHNARSRRYGRARPGDGAVFRYVALAAGQTFEAAVVCDDRADAETLRVLLCGADNVRLGGSDTAGYGAARIGQVSSVREDWREIERHEYRESSDSEPDGEDIYASDAPEDEDSDGKQPFLEPLDSKDNAPAVGNVNASVRFTLTLLSDTLVRDEYGQWALGAEAVVRAVETRLRLMPGTLSVTDAFFRGRVVGGFNRTWGLPLPQAQAIQMGSVVVMEGPSLPVEDRLKLEAEGLGERRAEGFGRVALNWSYGAVIRQDASDTKPPGFSGVLPAGQTQVWASEIARRLFERRLEARLEEAAGNTFVSNPPTGAQIGRLRDVLRDERSQKSFNPIRVQNYLADISSRASAGQQFRKARINGVSMDKWLVDWLVKAAAAPNWQQISVQLEDFRTVGKLSLEVDALWPGAVLRYLDAVLACAAKKARRQKENE